MYLLIQNYFHLLVFSKQRNETYVIDALIFSYVFVIFFFFYYGFSQLRKRFSNKIQRRSSYFLSCSFWFICNTNASYLICKDSHIALCNCKCWVK